MNKSIPSLMCRICGTTEETIVHLLAACPILATTAYLHCHNLVTAVIHWHLIRFYSFQSCSRSWYSHKPLPVIKSSTAKILWDFRLVTNFNHPSNRPDIVLYDFHRFLAQQTLMFQLKRMKRLINIALWQQISIKCITCQLPLSQLFWDVRAWFPLVVYSF